VIEILGDEWFDLPFDHDRKLRSWKHKRDFFAYECLADIIRARVRKTIRNGVNKLENQAVDSRVEGELGRRSSAVKVDDTVRKRILPADWIRSNGSGRTDQAKIC
jgi:hypothetical protein